MTTPIQVSVLQGFNGHAAEPICRPSLVKPNPTAHCSEAHRSDVDTSARR